MMYKIPRHSYSVWKGTVMKTHESICLGIPEISLPKPGTDLTKWAVIACDQYTSEPEYWQRAAEIVGSAPSTLNLIYPEVYLNEKDPDARIAGIRRHMKDYLGCRPVPRDRRLRLCRAPDRSAAPARG